MSLPIHATTYQLTREQVSGQQACGFRDQALRCLAAAGVPAAVDTDGVIRGVLGVEPRRFRTLPGAPIAPRQAFEVRVPGTLRFADPSPLSQLGDLPFLEAPSQTRLLEKIIRAWGQRVLLIEAAVLSARDLAPNAQLFGDPWRIEGEMSFGSHLVRMMFSTRGDRACVCGLDGRPVDRAPVRRKILPVDQELTGEIWHALLAEAVGQARACLGPPVISREERQLSVDLASRDLEIRPTVDVPVHMAPTVVSRPPRRSPRPQVVPPDQRPTVIGPPPSPPPRRPPPASGPTLRAVARPDPRGLALTIDDADVLVTTDLSTRDLP